MFNFLRNFDLDSSSFWIGFIIGSILWWLLNTFRPLLRQGWQAVRGQISQAREGLTTGTEKRLANDTLRYVQSLHLASPLFSLDEIRIEPRLLAPPQRALPGEEISPGDIVSRTIPYMPVWPEFAGVYGGKTLTIPEAMSKGANLVILGKAGTGKTFALADLASKVARAAPDSGDLAELIPLYIHVFDLDPTLDEEKSPREALQTAVLSHASALTTRQLPRLLESALNLGRGLILLDGLDELTEEQFDVYVNYLEALLVAYPKVRLVVTADPRYIGGLERLGLIPVPLAAWSSWQKRAFVERWQNLWIRWVNPEIWPTELDTASQPDDIFQPAFSALPVDPLMINGWILNDPGSLTPLELTLKVWSGYAGDMLGRRPVEAIEAYIRRMTADLPTGRLALEKLALTLTKSMQPIISQNKVDAVSAGLPAGDPDEFDDLDLEEGAKTIPAPASPSQVSIRRAIPRLINAGLVRNWDSSLISFNHPVMMGYLAGSYLTGPEEIESLYHQPDWSGRMLAMKYLAACGEASSLAMKLMETSEDPLQRELLTLGSWLGDAPHADNWRALVMRRLAKLLQNDVYTMGLRCQALTTLAIAGDEDVAVLFRHLLTSDKPQVRQMAALGAGFLQDKEAVTELAVKLYDPSPNVQRAACLALVNIGGDNALEQTAAALLHGSEDLRQAAAEAFANHPEEGFPLLRDGAKLEDLLVRRAVIYGIKRVKEAWAAEHLETMQLEDEQWVVRNAATQAVEELNKPDRQIPMPQVELQETPWLIAFAGERGMGVTAGKPAQEMLKVALKEGKITEKLAAMEQVYRKPDPGLVLVLYHELYGGDEDLREGAYHAVWQLDASGVDLPSPAQFGIGA
jgi:HEAT repeat protein